MMKVIVIVPDSGNDPEGLTVKKEMEGNNGGADQAQGFISYVDGSNKKVLCTTAKGNIKPHI